MASAHRIVVLISLTFILLMPASSTSLINSDDWRTVALSENLADLRAEQTFTIATSEDARVAKYVIEDPEMVYTGSSPTVPGLEDRLDLNFTGTYEVSNKQFDTSSQGFVVVNGDFGTDAISVLSYANRKNYRLVFYDSSIAENLNKSSQPKVFYGEFGFDPEKRFNAAKHIEGLWMERNLEIASRTESRSAVLTPRSYFDPSEVGDQPVLFKMERDRLAEFLQGSSIENIKVSGVENTLYAKELDVLTEKDLDIVVKTGRAFTGIPELDKVYDLKKIEMPYRRFNLTYSGLVLGANSSKVGVKFLNRGNTERELNLTLDANNTREVDLTLPEFSSLTYTWNASDFSNITVNYSTQRTEDNVQIEKDQVRQERITSVKRLEVEGVNYSESSGTLEVGMKNKGEETAWGMIQVGGEYERVKVLPGETGDIKMEGISDSENFIFFRGRFHNQFLESMTYPLEDRRPIALIWVLLAAIPVFAFSFYVLYEFIY